MISHFEHFATFCKDNNLQTTLERWKKAGFLIHDNPTKHPRGRTNGFITLTGGYFELCSITNETEFINNCSPVEIELRKNPCLHLSVMSSSDPKEIWNILKDKFPQMAQSNEKFYAMTPSGVEYCSIPMTGTPGAFISAIKYPKDKKTEFLRQFLVGKNAIYGVTGILLVTNDPMKESLTWFDTLASVWKDAKLIDDIIDNGLQSIGWISQNKYENFFGKWSPVSKEYNRIGVIKLGSENLEQTEIMLSEAGFDVYKHDGRLHVKRDENTGVSLIIEKGIGKEFYRNLMLIS